MIAWWSVTLASLTTRPSGSTSSPVDVGGGLARTRGCVPTSAGGRLELGDHVAGQEARVRARVGERLVLLVQALGGGQRAPGGEAEARVGVALQRREVVEERRALLLGRLLELGDLARLVADGGDDRLGLLGGLQPRLGAGVEAALVAAAGVAGGRLELRVDEPVRLGLERADLLLAAGEDRERRRLHAAERDGAVERRAQADRGRARGVHADDPVGLRARAGGLLEPRRTPSRGRSVPNASRDRGGRSSTTATAARRASSRPPSRNVQAKISSPSRPASQALTTSSTSSRLSSLVMTVICFFERSSRTTSLNSSGTIGRSAIRHFLYLGSYSSGSASWTRWPTAHVTTCESDSR